MIKSFFIDSDFVSGADPRFQGRVVAVVEFMDRDWEVLNLLDESGNIFELGDLHGEDKLKFTEQISGYAQDRILKDS